MTIEVQSIYRYPIKGLSAEPLERVMLATSRCLPHDRRFALARASTVIDLANPVWLPKIRFFMLMRDERLALLHTRFDEASGTVTVEQGGRPVLAACITDADGKRSFEAFFADFLKGNPDGPPRLVEVPGRSFADARPKPNASTDQYVSLVNLASVRAFEQVAKVPVDPLRFRANVHFDGPPAWEELGWVGREFRLGSARLRIVSPIIRCPATAVNPSTAERDLDIPFILMSNYQHNHMGVYAEVLEGGEFSVGGHLTCA